MSEAIQPLTVEVPFIRSKGLQALCWYPCMYPRKEIRAAVAGIKMQRNEGCHWLASHDAFVEDTPGQTICPLGNHMPPSDMADADSVGSANVLPKPVPDASPNHIWL
jgi:hypothetical protein